MKGSILQAKTCSHHRVYFCQLLADEYAMQLSSLEGSLTSDERDRARRFARFRDRIQFVLGRAAVRRICSKICNIRPTDVRIALSAAGKPYVTWPDTRFEFNISHANGMVVIAWSNSCCVGVDVESTDQAIPVDEIAREVLSKAEREVLSAVRSDQRAEMFFRIWVRKEAVLKAEGCGISKGLSKFSTVHEHNSRVQTPLSLFFPSTMTSWKIVELLVPPKYIVALAIPPRAELVFCPPDEIGLARSVARSGTTQASVNRFINA